MRSDHRRHHTTFSIGLPASVVGSLALLFGATPAHAAVEPVAADLRATDLPLGAEQTRPAQAVAPVAAKKKHKTYTVKAGDTVWGIAQRYGLSTRDLVRLNDLGASALIHPGQVLKLSGSASASTTSAKSRSTTAKTSGRYTVRAGDTVWAIAQKHGTSVAALLKANKLGAGAIIYPGQKLTISGGDGSGQQAAASASKKKASTSKATSSSKTHVVKAGDTLWAIAKKHGTSVAAILSANGLGSGAIIYPGQKIRIPGASTATRASSTSGIVTLDKEQTANAKLIIRVGRSMGASERAIAIALGTAMQESSLRNLRHGDRDSQGLFQQRPSTGWGTVSQVRDAIRSTKAFFGGENDPNGSRTRGLYDIPNWQDLSFTEAAQAVQISAYPDAYAKWEKHAKAWLAALG
ncbi:LysM peptidoglycan-binding domain-containing protein [Microbacterium fluvii]|uniref:LysM peptidoglycan-binding domain-containing protein n=1 Tax=Microbacterium fluvii TaxID=415215 RepID=A0ABW2HGA1_9MICO|nr:LysM peptidoglycan-binding domain-containing protein [Microbacterium fluvii]MCU4673628.1 LysM peptidoglycan-binding domain-containing protein [Microbacterium fluvii]